MQQSDLTKRKSIWPYIFVILSALVLMAGTFAWVYTKMIAMEEETIRFRMKSRHVFTLPAAGKYSINHEYLSNLDGVFSDTKGKLVGVTLDVRMAEGGESLQLLQPKMTITSSNEASSTESVLLFDFDAPTAGDYEITAKWQEPENRTDFVLKIEPAGRLGDILLTIVISVVVNLACTVGVIVTCVVIYLRRRKAARLLHQGNA